MQNTSRRAFLAMTGTGALAVTSVGLAEEADAKISQQDDADAYDAANADNALVVAYLHDARTGVINVVSGDEEVTIIDKKLAAKLTNLVKKGR